MGERLGDANTHPILVAVAGKEDIVADVVIVQVLEGSIAVGGISLVHEEKFQHGSVSAYQAI